MKKKLPQSNLTIISLLIKQFKNYKSFFLFLIVIIIPSFSFAQFVTGAAPVQDGTITSAEYYNSTGVGANGGVWYMAWDSTNLYIAKTGGATGEPDILYFDTNPTSYSNGGVATGTNGQTTGQSDYGSTPNLPFVAKARVYWDATYAEVTINTGSGWGTPILITTRTNSGNNREILIPWATLTGSAGMPAAFNWLATASSTSGYIYDQYPIANYGGNGSTTPTYFYYQTVLHTAGTYNVSIPNSGITNPFNSNFTSFTNYNNSSFGYISSLPTSVYDFTLGNTSSAGSVNVQTDFSVLGNLVVKNGVLNSGGGDGSGFYKITMGNAAGVLNIFTNSGGHIYGTDNGVGNNLGLIVAGVIALGGDPATPFTDDHKFYNIFVQSSGALILQQGLLCRYGGLNIAGTLQINANGYIEGYASSASKAAYLNLSAALIYNNGGPYLASDYEWSTVNAPANVTIEDSGTAVTLNDAKSISGTLSLVNGIVITTDSTLLTISDSLNTGITGGSPTSFIQGPVTWNLPASATGTYTFPVGIVDSSLPIDNDPLPSDRNLSIVTPVYLPFSIVPTTTTTTSATVQAFGTGSGGTWDASLSSISTSEYWMLSTNSGFGGATISAARSYPAIEYRTLIGHSNTVTGVYSSIGGSTGTLSGQSGVLGSTLTSLSDTNFIVLATPTSLPVTFISENVAVNKNGAVQVKWQVANEIGISSYQVERSNNGGQFVKVGTVEASGSTNYLYVDNTSNKFSGSILYRIKAISVSGNNLYSPTVSLNIKQAHPSISVNPNPVEDGQIHWTVSDIATGIYTIRLIGISGQVLSTSSFNFIGGTLQGILPIPSSVSSGIYQLEFIGSTGQPFVQKVLIGEKF